MGDAGSGRSVAAWLFAAALGHALACTTTTSFQCSNDGQCEDGMCVAPGFCAFPSDDCDSGFAFGQHSSSDLAGTCVPATNATSTGAPIESDESTDGGESSGTSSDSGADTLAADDEGSTSTGEPVIDCTQWWDLAWSSRRALEAGNDQLSETLADFPVPIPVDDRLGADTTALRFVGPGCAELPFDLEVSEDGEPLVAWVRWPEVGATPTTIHAYYGNADAPPAPDGTAVWDEGYRAVWHLSTTADGTGAHGLTTGEVVAEPGQLGMALRFDGVDDSIQSGATPSLAFDTVTAMSISGWVRVDGLPMPANDRVIDKSESTTSELGFAVSAHVNASDLLEIDFNRGGEGGEYQATTQGADMELGTWHHFGVSYDPPQDAVILVNGQIFPLDFLPPVGPPLSDADRPITLGAAPYSNNRFLDGALDELRLSTVARSVDWHLAEYLAATDALVTMGDEELAP